MIRKTLIVACVTLAVPIPLLAQVKSPATKRIQFETNRDLLESMPGDSLKLVTTDKKKAVQWTVNYSRKGAHACFKDFPQRALAKASAIRFHCRANPRMQLWVQLNEEGGEKYYKTITVEKSWKPITIPLGELALNKDRVVNGRLDMEKVRRLVLLDVASVSGKASGVQSVWFADLEFISGEPAARPIRPAFAQTLRTGKVGLTCVPRNFRENESDWIDLFSKANDSGVQLLSLQADFWSKTESASGVYDFRSWDKFFAVLEKSGYQFELSKDIGGPFFRERIDVPKDIRFKSFTDPTLLRRFRQYLTAYLDRFGKRHAYIVIHAEGADAYFAKRPSQFADFCRFLWEVRTTVKQHSPHIQVGVNTEPTNEDFVLRSMANATDFMAYDVLQGQIRKADGFENIVTRLAKLSGEKKIAFQNVGWSTSKTDNSSEAQQAAFIGEFYDVLFRHRDRIEYASFGALYDHDMAITGPAYRAAFPDLPADAVDKIIDSMSHCGMIRSDGQPKPGWTVFREQVANYYQR